ncbi:MAG: hypothetical protein IPG18_12545 [Saprospiraceae bacterium]|nr:hypothetical protein [Saprospiraceae bacterium]MBP6695893.1 hypothetical protein [Saprospiraceae bacterium]
MEFISEVKIEQIIQKYEETDNFEKDLNELKNENPLLLEFISEERLELLKKEEQALLEFMTVVIYSATKSSINNIPKIKGLVLEEAEEKNYELWENAGKKSQKTAFDVYFDGYAQEDLLAFVEDSLQQDDENPVTTVGIELIAVSTKSIIDALHVCN